MSAIGTKRTYDEPVVMSANDPKRTAVMDIAGVRHGPSARRSRESSLRSRGWSKAETLMRGKPEVK
jgi:hypothetical protein